MNIQYPWISILLDIHISMDIHWYPWISSDTDKTSLKADREVQGGGFTWNHFDFTSISLWHPLKPPQIIGKRSDRAKRHRGISGTKGTSETQKSIEKQRTASLYTPRTHAGITREAPSSRRPTFYLISQNKVEHQTQRAWGRHRTRSTIDNKKPSDRITHAGTIKISRSE